MNIKNKNYNINDCDKIEVEIEDTNTKPFNIIKTYNDETLYFSMNNEDYTCRDINKFLYMYCEKDNYRILTTVLSLEQTKLLVDILKTLIGIHELQEEIYNKDVKEMTLSEIERKLGHKIKLVTE